MRKKDGQTEGFHSKSGLCLHMTLQQQLPSPPPCRWHDVGSGNPSSACTTPQPPVGGAAVDESLGWRLFIALYLPVCSRDLADLSCDQSVCVCVYSEVSHQVGAPIRPLITSAICGSAGATSSPGAPSLLQGGGSILCEHCMSSMADPMPLAGQHVPP